MKHKFISISIALVLALSLCLVTAVPVAAQVTFNVPGDYDTIQEAITAAAPGSTVNVAAGDYTENVVVDKQLFLVGAGSSSVTVTSAADPVDSVFTVSANGVEISGFKVTGAGAWGVEWPTGVEEIIAGIYIGKDVTGCNIHDNVLEGNRDGIYLDEGSNYNTFERNDASGNYMGFELTWRATTESHHNTFIGNIANENYKFGFFIVSSSDNTFIDNTANGNGEGDDGRGFWAKIGQGDGNHDNTFTGNTANGNSRTGFQLNMGTGTTFTGNTADANLGSGDAEEAGIVIDSDASAPLRNFTMTGNTISNHELGIVIWTVDETGFDSLVINYNNIVGNGLGIRHQDSPGTLNAQYNWWGTIEESVILGMILDDDDSLVDHSNWLPGSYPLAGGTDVGGEVAGVTSVSPNLGDINTTLEGVVITGYGLFAAADTGAVSFGDGITVDSYSVDSEIQIIATISIAADAAAGPRAVTVSIPEGNIVGADLFTVLESLTLTAPTGFNLGMMVPGYTTEGASDTAGIVVTNYTAWTVDAVDLSTGGFMQNATLTALAEPFQIGEVEFTYFDADPGITYADNPVTLPLFVSQQVVTGDEVGAYSITITFTGSY